MRYKALMIMLLCALLLLAGCYPIGVGKEVRKCKDATSIEAQACLAGVVYAIADDHPKAAIRICEEEIGGYYDEEKPLEHIAGQIIVNGCLQIVENP